MEFGVGGGEAIGIAARWPSDPSRGSRRATARDARPCCASRATARCDGARLERDARLDQFVDAPVGDRPQPDAAIGLVDDDPLALEQPQRLAHRHPADAELAGKIGLDDAIARQDHARRARPARSRRSPGRPWSAAAADAARLPRRPRARRAAAALRRRTDGSSLHLDLTRYADCIRSYDLRRQRRRSALSERSPEPRPLRHRSRCSGRQAGYLRAPLSRNTSGWGTVEIPIVSVKNGSGPTILFTGGVHGDEYEGPDRGVAPRAHARSRDRAGPGHHDPGRSTCRP